MPEKQNIWITTSKKVSETAKFLKVGSKVIVKGSVAPQEAEVEGKWGKRNMYIIETVDYGVVYVNAMQLLHIASILENHNFADTTVEL